MMDNFRKILLVIPQTAIQYYNYMRGLWRDGTRFVYGASGNISSSGALANVNTDYCFPGDSDPSIGQHQELLLTLNGVNNSCSRTFI